jgi:hypothetical protein
MRFLKDIAGRRRIENIARTHNLPIWWIQSAVIEHLPCRRFLENGRLWQFDFNIFDKKSVATILDKSVVVPEYYIVQNVSRNDFFQRLQMSAFGGSPVAEMEEKELFPEGILNDTCFTVLGNPIDIWDPKLGFNTHTVVLDSGLLYQWKIASLYHINDHSSWYKSDLFNLLPLWNIYQKIKLMNTPDNLNDPTDETKARLEDHYNNLESGRVTLREKIWEYHLEKKSEIENVRTTPSNTPRFTILDSFRYRNGQHYVYSPIEPLFYRAALRNSKLAMKWHQEYSKTSEHNAMHKEIEYSLMTIISANSCLEAYINMIIERYPTKP